MRVTSKGQVTIPRDLRELAGIEPNSDVIFSIENGKLVLEPKQGNQQQDDAARLQSLLATLDTLAGTGDQDISADDLMSITRDR